jgi:hypothetical protein
MKQNGLSIKSKETIDVLCRGQTAAGMVTGGVCEKNAQNVAQPILVR